MIDNGLPDTEDDGVGIAECAEDKDRCGGGLG